MKFANLNGIIIHYSVEGPTDAPAIIFANSLGSDFRIWSEVTEALKDRFKLIRYDKRGHGLSEAPSEPYSIEDHIADLSALLDHLEVKSTIVVGLSVGGVIAQGLAGARPELVRALVLCDTGHKIGDTEMWNSRITTIRATGLQDAADSILERWFPPAFHQTNPTDIRGWRSMVVRTPIEGYLGTCAALRDADMTDIARSISVPTLCVVGSEDAATVPELVQSTADLIPGARFEVIKGSGHLPCIDNPGKLLQSITNFLSDNNLA